MDPTRFDTFTRLLTQRAAESPSRRTVLHGLGGFLFAGALTDSEANAKRKKKHKKKCKAGK
jgi:hypothetical protein